ncbi:UDP-N-acetylmuramoyl-L-alanine--D-glutamate ligase [Candidatus Palibaumannia cicadellinicola]|uniref:UDP-N-acetylmuramoylalanine--D-glutamate ligase n=2 Tax=cellular organisms TaxID=131567 RepID=MURD_BAUCH|nr:UDP-N-acetylmuramoyl-L-alanine--D-glutamate ligase [Candidatus Baumannia cicadellinicola]Q1LSW4.1 RecName: Full=UDP-N-acetylmuramoylalanine--D-glutamate ligase; AltName: Full=D-glutamic acid-adding enzyme; AltName: Full=UDP-N-acetylmuramoyl-L-alanyl-D-glutamate synthetase [Baumannia cicadellinicola str. Hc (Homalodisca coagulata)]ABF14267.1 UDP-N-acetylmuramoylalanine--D-glutamate ligase [Baumannia cicadellinicola str. Hc (Homalodisca coagulata)]MCJ7462188.1 UDP-N-acetylmuramoyl-L-alanine--D-
MTNYYGHNIVIIGLGITGITCVNFFRSRGITPRVMDTRYNPPQLNQLPKDIQYWLGELKIEWLLAATLIVISPGISLSHPAINTAMKCGIEIIGDVELFLREVTVPVVAITGTNGKSTVAKLVGTMANCAGLKVGVGGNIGYPVLSLLQQSHQLYVLELSSFQLETTKNLKVAVATILNISEDHMDRYPLGLQQYREAKLKIYKQAKIYIINDDDKLTLPANSTNKEYCSIIKFGIKSGHYCLGDYQGKQWLMAYGKPLLDCNEIKIIGRHNLLNALAALALAEAIAIPRQACLIALRQFSGLMHRFELVLERKGIRWINDSKATNVGSTKAALNELTVDGTLHLLLGGDGKLADFSSLQPFVQGNNIHLYCFGKDSKKLAALNQHSATITQTLSQAMHIINNQVKAGDVVLLSPACSSLDQFENFKVRGKTFTNLVFEFNDGNNN